MIPKVFNPATMRLPIKIGRSGIKSKTLKQLYSDLLNCIGDVLNEPTIVTNLEGVIKEHLDIFIKATKEAHLKALKAKAKGLKNYAGSISPIIGELEKQANTLKRLLLDQQRYLRVENLPPELEDGLRVETFRQNALNAIQRYAQSQLKIKCNLTLKKLRL